MKSKSGIHERFKFAIEQSGISQRQLAIKLGIDPSNITHIINGRSFLQFELAVKACEILGISMDWLAWGKEDEKNKEAELLARLNASEQKSKEARIEYMLAIVRDMDKTSADEIYEFTIIELDKKIRAVINRSQKTANIDEIAL